MQVKGLGSMSHNPTSHDRRLSRRVTDEELLELLTNLSMIHRPARAVRLCRTRGSDRRRWISARTSSKTEKQRDS
jgi:hypothetical protein